MAINLRVPLAVFFLVGVSAVGLVARTEPPPFRPSEPEGARAKLPAFELHDERHRASIAIGLPGARPVVPRRAGTRLAYDSTLPGGDLFVETRPDGFEDRMLLRQAPEEGIVRYSVTMAGISGLRKLDGESTVEFLNDQGTPLFRMTAPWWRPGNSVEGPADGSEQPLETSIPDCEYDRSPAPPWGRAPIALRNKACTIELRWHESRVPAVIDPIWTTTASMAHPRNSHLAQGLGNRALVAGGWGASADLAGESGSELWDAQTQTWAVTGALPFGWQAPAWVRLADGRILMAGGSSATVLDQAALFDPIAGTWTLTGQMTARRKGHTLTLLPDGRVLAAGGQSSFSEEAALATSEIYDPNTGQWAPAGVMPRARTRHGAAMLADNRVLVAGGVGIPDDGEKPFSAVFDIATSVWSNEAAPAATGAYTSIISLGDGRALLVGVGLDWGNVTAIFDPTIGNWTAGPASPVPVTDGVVVLLKNGSVLLAGGNDGNGPSPETTMYRPGPTGGTWAPLGPLAHGRIHARGALLEDGSVLVTGGFSLDSVPAGTQASAELLTFSGLGSACQHAAQCATSHCVDGVCCENACSEGCTACSKLARGSGPDDGLCAPIAEGMDPREACSKQPPCGSTGSCDGKGACAIEKAGESCGALTCVAGTLRLMECDGSGLCKTVERTCPGDFVCAADGSCITSCVQDTDCVSGLRCHSGACVSRSEKGSACSGVPAECRPGLECVDGLCCDTGGVGTCGPYRCTSAGVCATGCASSADCAVGARCDGEGHCSGEKVTEGTASGCSCSLARRSPGDWTVAVAGMLSALLCSRARRRA